MGSGTGSSSGGESPGDFANSPRAMKTPAFCRILLTAAGVAALCSVAAGDAPLAPAAQTAASSPTIVVLTQKPQSTNATYDFGRVLVSATAPISHVFTLKNGSDAEISLTEVRPTCGCTTAVIGNDAAGGTSTPVLAPGQSADVRVDVDPARVSTGRITKSILVFAKGQPRPIAVLEVTGLIDPGVTFNPTPVDFGEVIAGTEVQRSLLLTVNPDFKLTETPRLSSTVPSLLISQPEPGHNAQGLSTFKYTLTLPRDAYIGVISGVVILMRPDSAGKLANINVAVCGTVKGDVAASPNTVIFGAATAGRGAVQKVMLTGVSKTSLDHLKIVSTSNYVTASIGKALPSPDTPAVASMEVNLSPKTPAGSISSQLILQTETGQQLLLPVYAYVPEPAQP